MSTINDIIFSKIGSKKRLRDPDWSKVPIWFHVIDPALIDSRTKIDFQTGPDPGIHYAYPGIMPLGSIILDVEKDIRTILDECLNHMDPPEPPAGMVRGHLKNIVPPVSRFNYDQREKFYNLGINPIVYHNGRLVLWGQRFCTKVGVFEEIIGVDKIHPEFEAFL